MSKVKSSKDGIMVETETPLSTSIMTMTMEPECPTAMTGIGPSSLRYVYLAAR